MDDSIETFSEGSSLPEEKLVERFNTATSDLQRMLAVQDAINDKMFVLDDGVRAILKDSKFASELELWCFAYAGDRDWWSLEDWENALNWVNVQLTIMALNTIGFNGWTRFKDYVDRMTLPSHVADEELFERCETALRRCQESMGCPRFSYLIYNL